MLLTCWSELVSNYVQKLSWGWDISAFRTYMDDQLQLDLEFCTPRHKPPGLEWGFTGSSLAAFTPLDRWKIYMCDLGLIPSPLLEFTHAHE